MGSVQCRTDLCVWKLVKGTSQGPQLQVLALFHIDDFMLAGRKGEAGWEEFQRRMHKKWKWFEWEQGHLRMTGVDVTQLQDGIFLMDQKAYVDNIDLAEINSERRKTPEAGVTEREKSTLRGSLGSNAMAVHTDGREESMRRINVTIFASSRNRRYADEIQSNPQRGEVRSRGSTSARTSQ